MILSLRWLAFRISCRWSKKSFAVVRERERETLFTNRPKRPKKSKFQIWSNVKHSLVETGNVYVFVFFFVFSSRNREETRFYVFFSSLSHSRRLSYLWLIGFGQQPMSRVEKGDVHLWFSLLFWQRTPRRDSFAIIKVFLSHQHTQTHKHKTERNGIISQGVGDRIQQSSRCDSR